MKITSATFVTSAADLAGCPRLAPPEFAFIGRSNVGKSSLINLLAGRNALAKTSATPGKTRLINFFLINGAWLLVDLPGYGYAKVSQSRRADFNEAVADYLEHRENLRRAFVLIDARLDPQAIDLEFLHWLADVEAPFALVFTKIDKVSGNVLQKNASAFRRALAERCAVEAPVFFSSSVSGRGRSELLQCIAADVRRAREDSNATVS